MYMTMNPFSGHLYFYDAPSLPPHQTSRQADYFFLQEPDPDLEDPLLAQARALEYFHSSQIRNGYELFNQGCIETAGHYQNLFRYLEERVRLGVILEDPFEDQDDFYRGGI